MKLELNKNHRSPATRRIRLVSPRLPRRRSALALSTGENSAEKPQVSLSADSEPATPKRTESTRDALQLYLREIGQVKLLTAEEELTLASRVKRGDKAAREQMIKANLRLVVKIA